MNAVQYREKFARAQGRKAGAVTRLDQTKNRLEGLQQEASALELAQAFLQQTAKETQEQLRYHVEDIINMALDTCFPGEYRFELVFEIKRGKTEADLVFWKNGNRVNPMDSDGGGVVDIAAFALRMAAYTLSTNDNVIVLDEPFRFLSKDLMPRAGDILRELSHRLKVQYIMVTHAQDLVLCADRVFEVSQDHKTGVSAVVARE